MCESLGRLQPSQQPIVLGAVSVTHDFLEPIEPTIKIVRIHRFPETIAKEERAPFCPYRYIPQLVVVEVVLGVPRKGFQHRLGSATSTPSI